MIEMFDEIWGELYWNTSDWMPWLLAQVIFSAAVGGVIQWWFKREGLLAFLIVLGISLFGNIMRLPPKAISDVEIAKMNEKFPQDFDGISINSVSFAHRFLTFQAFSPEPLDGFEINKDMTIEQCKVYGAWLASRRIKQVQYVVSWPDGGTTLAITDADCRSIRR